MKSVRLPEEVAENRAKVAELVLKGLNPKDIANEIGISTAMVISDIHAISQQWSNAPIIFKNLDTFRIKELKKLDIIEKELWEQWEISKAGKRTTMVRTTFRGDTTEDTEEFSGGDPKYIDGILRCMDQRAKILGLNQPKKVENKVEITDNNAMDVRGEVLAAIEEARKRSLRNNELMGNLSSQNLLPEAKETLEDSNNSLPEKVFAENGPIIDIN